MARISKAQLEKLQKKYKTDEAVGKLFGISRQAVHQLRSKYGIAPIKDKYRERNEAIIRSYGTGQSGIKVAKRFMLSASQAYRIIGRQKPVARKEKKQ